MTTIDHQQAAIDEVAKAIDTSLAGESWGEFTTRVTAAATPHLRASVAEEVRDFRDCYQHTYAIPGDPYAEGYLTACKAIIALLEGGEE